MDANDSLTTICTPSTLSGACTQISPDPTNYSLQVVFASAAMAIALILVLGFFKNRIRTPVLVFLFALIIGAGIGFSYYKYRHYVHLDCITNGTSLTAC